MSLRRTAHGPFYSERNSDGSIAVHSAAQWFGPNASNTISGVNAWFGRGTYNSNASGFTSPLYTWGLQGGSVEGSKAGQIGTASRVLPSIGLNPGPEGSTGYQNMNGLKLGGGYTSTSSTGTRYIKLTPNLAATGATAQTTIKVKVQDSDGTIADTPYNVTWHLPAENWQKLSEVPIQPLILPLEGDNYIGAVMRFQNQFGRSEIDYGTTLSVAGTLIGGTEAAYLLAVGGTLAAPEVALVALASAVVSAGGTLIGSPPAALPSNVPSTVTDYAAYKAAVVAQRQSGNYPDGTRRFSPDTAIADAEASFKPQMYTDDNNSTNDDNIARSVTISGRVFFDQNRETWQCDEYDGQGYKGPNTGHRTLRLAPYYRVTFTASGTPGPNPLPTSSPTAPPAG